MLLKLALLNELTKSLNIRSNWKYWWGYPTDGAI